MNERETDEDTLICRCQEVTLGQVRKAIREGARSLREVKLATEAGMGLCQGRTCTRLIAREIARQTGVPEADLLTRRARSPVRPVPLEALGDEAPS